MRVLLYALLPVTLFGVLGLAVTMIVVSPLLFAVIVIAIGLAAHEGVRWLRRAMRRARTRVVPPARTSAHARLVVRHESPARLRGATVCDGT